MKSKATKSTIDIKISFSKKSKNSIECKIYDVLDRVSEDSNDRNSLCKSTLMKYFIDYLEENGLHYEEETSPRKRVSKNHSVPRDDVPRSDDDDFDFKNPMDADT